MNNAYIVSASQNYLPGLRALLNSLEYHGNKYDVILFNHGITEEFNYSFKIIEVKTEGDQVQQTAIKRFDTSYYKDYDVVCLLDADMFFTANCDFFFDVASKGFIITGSNGMVIKFDKDYQNKYKVNWGKDILYTKVHTTVPIFISKQDYDWFDALYNSQKIDSFDDFLYLNILGIDMGKDKKMITLPPYTFTGIHHWQLKPETSIRMAGDIMLSGTEEQVYIVHGKWWDKAWTQDLLPTMTRYFKDNTMGDRCLQRTTDAIKTITMEFKKYSAEEDI